MEIYKGYIIMAIGAGVILFAVIGLIIASAIYHKRKDKLMNDYYEE